MFGLTYEQRKLFTKGTRHPVKTSIIYCKISSKPNWPSFYRHGGLGFGV